MLTNFRTLTSAFINGDLTAAGVVSASCGDSEQWCSTTTVVQNNSGSWGTGGTFDPTFLQSASANWESTYTTVSSFSATWGGGTANILIQETAPVSPTVGDLWFDSTTGELNLYYDDGNSQQWVDVGNSTFNDGGTGGDSYDHTLLETTSANWDSTYTTVSSNSATWGNGGYDDTALQAASGNWDSTYTTVSSNSAAWGIDTVYDDTALQAASGNWDSTYTTVSANSAAWGAGGTGTSTLSGVASVSDTTAKSLYTMSAGIPVEFESNDNNTLMYLDETSETVLIGTDTVPTSPQLDYKLHMEGSGSGTFGRTAFTVKNTNASSAAQFRLLQSNNGSVTVQAAGPSYVTPNVGSIGTANGLSLRIGTDGQTSSGGTNDVIFGPGGYANDTVWFKPDGKVGVGTSIPETLFHISESGGLARSWSAFAGTTLLFEQGDVTRNADLSITSDRAKIAGIFFGDQDDQNPGTVYYDNNTDSLHFGTNNALSQVIVDSSGQVGIGTTAPNELLTVAGNISATGTVTAGCGDSTEWCSSYSTVQSNSAAWGVDTIYDDSALQAASGNWDSTYTTVSSNSATWSDVGTLQTVTDAGNTTTNSISSDGAISWSGQYQLTESVAGAPVFRNTVSSQVANFRIQSADRDGTDSTSFNIDVLGQPGDANREAMIIGYFTTPTPKYIVRSGITGNGGLHPIRLEMGADDPTLVIDTNKNIGIGVDTPDTKLHAIDDIVAELKFTSGLSSGTPCLAVGNTAGGGKFASLIAGTNGSGFFYDQSGVFTIRSSPKSDYTNNTLGATGTVRLRIDTDGNVGIGTESPNELLTVAGNVSATGTVTADCGDSTEWCSSYSTVQSNSAGWGAGSDPYDDTALQAASGNWDSTYTTVSANSATWGSGGSTVVGPAVETTVYVDAGAMLARNAEASTSTGADDGVNNSVDWWNVALNERLFTKLAMPPQWDGSDIGVDIYWTLSGDNPVGEEVRWSVAAEVAGDDDPWDTTFTNKVSSADDVVLANGDIHTIGIDNITPGGTPTDGDILFLEIERIPVADGTDLPEDARILGMRIHYQNTSIQNWVITKMGNEVDDAGGAGEKTAWVAPAGGYISGVHFGSSTDATGSNLTADVKLGGISILSTTGVIAAGTDSTNAVGSTAPVLTTNPVQFSPGDRISFEIASFGGSGAKGLHSDLLISWS